MKIENEDDKGRRKKKKSTQYVGIEVAKRYAHEHVKTSVKCNDKIEVRCSLRHGLIYTVPPL